jgi:hypothetical protein
MSITSDSAFPEQPQAESPPGVLTWQSGAERNKLLRQWRRAIFAMFREQARALRLAWTLADLFNVKTGYAYPNNGWLAENTLIAETKVQATLAMLEEAGAIRRGWVSHNGQKRRVIYPATGILRCLGGTPTVGVGGDPQPLGAHNLRRRPRMPRTQHEHARLAAGVQSNGTARELSDALYGEGPQGANRGRKQGQEEAPEAGSPSGDDEVHALRRRAAETEQATEQEEQAVTEKRSNNK